VGPDSFVTESPFKHLSKFSSFCRRLFFFGAGIVLDSSLQMLCQIQRICTECHCGHTYSFFSLALCLMCEICMCLKCVMECFGTDNCAPCILPVRNLGKPGGRVSQNSQKGQNALVPLRLFNIMVFMICNMGMWISQWAQWVDPRKKPVHWTLCQGSNRGQIIHGGIIVYYME
jgi:hypothetical protein